MRVINHDQSVIGLRMAVVGGLARKSTMGRVVDDPLVGSVGGALFA